MICRNLSTAGLILATVSLFSLLVATGCDGNLFRDLEPVGDGGRPDGLSPSDADTAAPDTDTAAPDGTCLPESDAEFCRRHGAECGDVSRRDNCGRQRTVDCGELDGFGCDGLETCRLATDSPQLDANVCGCPDVDFDTDDATICDTLGLDCGSFAPADRCEDWAGEGYRTIDCGGCESGDECGRVGPNVCGCPCEIDGGCQSEGDRAPNSPCMICDPDASSSSYSQAPDGTACGDNAVCRRGTCTCESGWKRCDESCVDTTSNDDHCGACGNSCGRDQTCDNGDCICTDGTERCRDSCVDTQTDPDHCGGCGQACGDNEVCSGGRCESNCPRGEKPCSDACVDTSSNPDHCGGCGMSCSGCETCSDGACTDDDSRCSDGVCVDQQCVECATDRDCSGCQTCNSNNECVDDDDLCSGCESCSNGSCQDDDSNCDGSACEVCSGGSCKVACTGCQSCDGSGNCTDDDTMCNASSCETCTSGSCTVSCTGCETCDGSGNCTDDDSQCNANACEECTSGRCVSKCDGCLECSSGVCLQESSNCPNDETCCSDGTCGGSDGQVICSQ